MENKLAYYIGLGADAIEDVVFKIGEMVLKTSDAIFFSFVDEKAYFAKRISLNRIPVDSSKVGIEQELKMIDNLTSSTNKYLIKQKEEELKQANIKKLEELKQRENEFIQDTIKKLEESFQGQSEIDNTNQKKIISYVIPILKKIPNMQNIDFQDEETRRQLLDKFHVHVHKEIHNRIRTNSTMPKESTYTNKRQEYLTSKSGKTKKREESLMQQAVETACIRAVSLSLGGPHSVSHGKI